MTESKKEMWQAPECEEIFVNENTLNYSGSGFDGLGPDPSAGIS